MINHDCNPIKPFSSDGCTMFPDGDWGGCCYDHDLLYWRGGTWRDRIKADKSYRPWVLDVEHVAE